MLLLERANHSAGIAGGECIGGDVVGHYASGAYHGAVAYGHTGAYGDIAAQPAIFAYHYGVSRLDGLSALTIVEGMLRRVERAVGPDEGACAYGDVAGIEHHGVVVDKHIFAYMQAVAVVAVEWWQYGG